jgi:uncharacterized membrane protein YfcA
VTPSVYLAVFIVMVAGSTLQSSLGMGQGLLAAPLLRLLEPDLLPGPIVLAGFLTGTVLAMRNSKVADAREVTPAIFGRFAGAGVAIALLAALSERGLTITIGVIVLALVAARLGGLKIPRKSSTLAVTGFVSGIGGTIAALGGAPMGLLYEQHTRARDFRGPMGAFQMIGGVASLVLLTVAGQMDSRAWALGLALLPPLMLGWLLARWVTPIVDRGLLGPLVLIVSGASATVLILSEVF